MDTISDRLAPRLSVYRHPLKVLPYTWTSLRRFLVAFVIMSAIWSALGLAIRSWLQPSALGELEIDLNEWFARNRTETRTTWALGDRCRRIQS